MERLLYKTVCAKIVTNLKKTVTFATFFLLLLLLLLLPLVLFFPVDEDGTQERIHVC